MKSNAAISQAEVLGVIRDTARRQGAVRAIVFGSFARNTASRHSDVDAVFVAETTERFVERSDPYLRAVYDRLGLSADVFVYTPREFESMADSSFMRRVLQEGLVVYEH